LKDIIPPHSRRRITSTFSRLSSATKSSLSFGGKALWVISTSAFLLGVPWALAYAEEEQYVQMEREQGMIRGANEVRFRLFIPKLPKI
jgi:import receptor subunit TOM22